eukprot:CAMPEP_0206124240 /NCGR_PEP_ID=MMETSP1472-20131121/10636_1 /ASSEMBLY_ACC=CAM_ASM_001108 /TAXON_ID=41880 /ORGANISM="Pycnococcus provasolii, Strain RCC251" /LENGTH=103 /DNA_ID=CAMNT_0053514981 /DNA_START=250 /DNA_END=561 /DNA_ORIENTATION=+
MCVERALKRVWSAIAHACRIAVAASVHLLTPGGVLQFSSSLAPVVGMDGGDHSMESQNALTAQVESHVGHGAPRALPVAASTHDAVRALKGGPSADIEHALDL